MDPHRGPGKLLEVPDVVAVKMREQHHPDPFISEAAQLFPVRSGVDDRALTGIYEQGVAVGVPPSPPSGNELYPAFKMFSYY